MLSALYSRRVLVAVQCSAFQPAALAYRCVPFAGVWCGESCELCAARAVARLLYECATRDSLDRRPRLELAACKALAPSWLPNIRVLCLAGAPICKTDRRSCSSERCLLRCSLSGILKANGHNRERLAAIISNRRRRSNPTTHPTNPTTHPRLRFQAWLWLA